MNHEWKQVVLAGRHVVPVVKTDLHKGEGSEKGREMDRDMKKPETVAKLKHAHQIL